MKAVGLTLVIALALTLASVTLSAEEPEETTAREVAAGLAAGLGGSTNPEGRAASDEATADQLDAMQAELADELTAAKTADQE